MTELERKHKAMKTKKPLYALMHDISLSSITDPVCVGELEIALNVLERLKEQAPEMYKNMLNVKNAELNPEP